jgi:hypothetical protein
VPKRLADDPILDEALDSLDRPDHRLAPALDLGEIGLLGRLDLPELFREHVRGLDGIACAAIMMQGNRVFNRSNRRSVHVRSGVTKRITRRMP